MLAEVDLAWKSMKVRFGSTGKIKKAISVWVNPHIKLKTIVLINVGTLLVILFTFDS